MTEQRFYTKKRNVQYRGPSTSDDYNSRIEENYKDLTIIQNKMQVLSESIDYLHRMLSKSMTGYTVQSMEKADEIASLLESAEGYENIHFFGINLHLDTDRFDGTDFEVTTDEELSYDHIYNYVTLPIVENSSLSKIKFTASDGTEVVSPDFRVFVQGLGDVEDRPENIINANDFYNCVITDTTKRVWELNSIVDSSYHGESKFRIYVVIPDDLSLVRDTNFVEIMPAFNHELKLDNFKYSTQRNITFTQSDNWLPFEVPQYPINKPVANVIPDEENTGYVTKGGCFNFDPIAMTAISFDMTISLGSKDGDKRVYMGGLNKFDMRFNKYAAEGRAIFRIDAGPTAISSIDTILPYLANCSSSEVPTAFDYRVIWETSPDSGVYTLEEVPESESVWIEVTLRRTLNNGAPIISAIIVEKS